jgi:hypothetical protein
MAIACVILFIIGALSIAIGWEASNHYTKIDTRFLYSEKEKQKNLRDKKMIQVCYGIGAICFFFLFILLGSMLP